LRTDHQEGSFKFEPALGGFVVFIVTEILISTRLSGDPAEINFILRSDAIRTRDIAKVVSPTIQKYRNLRNFTREARLSLYMHHQWRVDRVCFKIQHKSISRAARIPANNFPATFTFASIFLMLTCNLLILLR
jgi:hypothetical protein